LATFSDFIIPLHNVAILDSSDN